MGQVAEGATQLQSGVASDTAEDKRLVAEVLSKDRKATAEFVSRYTDYLYSYVHRRVRPQTEVVEDLVQEIFIAAWQSLEKYRGEASLRIWLLGIARHKVDDYYRRRLRVLDAEEPDNESVVELAVIPTYEEQRDKVLLQAKARRVLASLPENYRLALLWRYQEDRSAREMAELTGKTEKAIERLLARARDTFRRRWNHAAP
jgi:RNA polymerase sigma-70 factor, ECF subfamily